MPTIVFPNAKNFDPSDNRPYADVVIANTYGSPISANYKCLVDTGSDFIVLPLSAATTAGLTLSGQMKTLRGVTGSSQLNYESNITIRIENLQITTDVLFDPNPSAQFIPILGRTAILTAFDLGMNTSQWLW